MALHCAGSLMEWNPHIHGLALDGAVLDDGHIVQLPAVDQDLLQEFFSQKVFAFLLNENLIEQSVVDQMRSWTHSGFSFYAGEPISGGDTDARLFVARYLKKAPLALSRLSIDESGSEPVVKLVSQPDDVAEGEGRERHFTPFEFLAALSQNVPNTFEQTTRYFGIYSPRTRGVARREEESSKQREDNFEPLTDELPQTPPSSSWASCMKRIFEFDPLCCPKCAGQMKIKSFITKQSEIERICKHLGISSWRAPPKFRKQPEQTWLDLSPEFSQLQ